MEQFEGVIYRSTGSWYVVKDKTGNFWNARIKGKLKIDEEISSTNPIAIGDKVLFQKENEAINTAIIQSVAQRTNYIARVSPHNKNQQHIVASNMDQALMIASITKPRTSQGFIDRFLITAEAYHIPAIIVFNKIDLLKDKQKKQLEHWCEMYMRAGYGVFETVALSENDIGKLSERIKNRTTLFCGHSGVGKSTLINQLMPGKELRTGAISDWSGKGLHTTTFAEMFDLPEEKGCIIDTPGVKEFGLINIERWELSHYFPEMRKILNDCRFNNCLHTNEPGCAVKEAVANGNIFEDRYVSYVTILNSLEEKWN